VPPAGSPEAAVLAVPWDDGGWLSPTHVHTWLAPTVCRSLTAWPSNWADTPSKPEKG